MKYMKLDQKGNAMAEYIWIDSTGGVRSKSRVRKARLFPLSRPVSRFPYLIGTVMPMSPATAHKVRARAPSLASLGSSLGPTLRPAMARAPPLIAAPRNLQGAPPEIPASPASRSGLGLPSLALEHTRRHKDPAAQTKAFVAGPVLAHPTRF